MDKQQHGQLPELNNDMPPREFRFLWLTGTWPATFRALRHRNFQLFWTGQMVSLIGTWMQNAAQAWFIPILVLDNFRTTNASFYLGLVSALGSAPMFLFSLLAGVLADRRDKRSILIVAQCGLMVLAFAFAILTQFHLIHVWVLASLAMLSGVASAFDMPTRQSYVKEMVGKADLHNAIALNSSIFNLARILGPPLTGLLIAIPWVGRNDPWLRMAGIFYLNGISYLAVIIGLLMIRTPPGPRVSSTASIWQHLGEGFRYVAKCPPILVLLFLMAIYSVFGFSYIVLMPVIARNVLHITTSNSLSQGALQYTMLVSMTGVGALIGALIMATLAGRARKGALLLAGGLIFAVALILFSLSRSLVFYYVMLPFVGGGLIIASASINSLIQEITPDELRGRVVGMWTFIFAGFTPIGALYAGLVGHLVSPLMTILIGALVCLLTMIGLSVRTPWLWRLE